MISDSKKDNQLSTPDGKVLIDFIDGVKLRSIPTISDHRGTLCEVFNFNWGFHAEPIVHVYQFTIRPKAVKGWVVHHFQDDRIFINKGTVKIVLYDDRPDSPTYKKINEIYMSELNRGILSVPKFVYHALQNVGTDDVMCINMPTKAYNYENPDKFRLPLNNDTIPYTFNL